MRPLTRREQNIFFLSVIMGVVYLGFYGLIRPVRAQIEQVATRMEEQNKKYLKNLRLIRKAEKLSPQIAYYLDRFSQKTSNEEVLTAILVEIEQVAGNHKIQISDLKPRKMFQNEFYNRYSVSLTLDSPFVDIMEFLYVLQKEPYLYNVEDLRFDQAARRNSESIKTRLILSKTLVP